MRTLRTLPALLLAALGLGACATGSYGVCKRDPATYALQCSPSYSGPGGVGLMVPLAAAVYAFKGCTVNGCELPNRCNPRTKRCEPIPCSETSSCPAGYRCMLDTKQCR